MTRHILCVILFLALILSMAGCNAAEPAETKAPTTTTTSAPTETQPEQTQATEVFPTETVPATTAPQETEPTETQPLVTEPAVTEPAVTEPPATEPPATEPPVTEPAQSEYEYGNHYVHILNYTPAPGEHGHIYWCSEGAGKFYKGEYTFDVDYKTITYEIWCSWGTVVQMAFRTSQTCNCSTDYEMTPEEKYEFNRIISYENYTCGFENHYCSSQSGHEHLLQEIANGCYYCGTSECVSFYARNEQGLTEQDKYLCPEYDVYRDPWFYCQICNKPKWTTIQDVTKCCFGYVHDTNCHYCGVWVGADDCHTCKQEDIDAWNAKQ